MKFQEQFNEEIQKAEDEAKKLESQFTEQVMAMRKKGVYTADDQRMLVQKEQEAKIQMGLMNRKLLVKKKQLEKERDDAFWKAAAKRTRKYCNCRTPTSSGQSSCHRFHHYWLVWPCSYRDVCANAKAFRRIACVNSSISMLASHRATTRWLAADCSAYHSHKTQKF